jgi:hypothetical protein
MENYKKAISIPAGRWLSDEIRCAECPTGSKAEARRLRQEAAARPFQSIQHHYQTVDDEGADR